MQKTQYTTTMDQSQAKAADAPPQTPDSGAAQPRPLVDHANQNPHQTAGQQNGHFKGVAIKAYATHTKQAKSDELILKFLPLVHKIVNQVVSYLHPPLSREDLISAGTIGLVKAARDFDPTQQAEFKTYAYIRVRGAVIDELRGWSFAPSGLRKKCEHAKEVLKEMTHALGRTPSDEELAKKLDMPLAKMYRMFENARARHFISIHGMSDEAPALGESLQAEDTAQPGERLEKAELAKKLADAIEQLPERQRNIIVLYYSKEMTMKKIADMLSVTESRVSQLHAGALFKLSAKLKEYDETRQQ